MKALLTTICAMSLTSLSHAETMDLTVITSPFAEQSVTLEVPELENCRTRGLTVEIEECVTPGATLDLGPTRLVKIVRRLSISGAYEGIPYSDVSYFGSFVLDGVLVPVTVTFTNRGAIQRLGNLEIGTEQAYTVVRR